MKKRIFTLFLSFCLLAGCAPSGNTNPSGSGSSGTNGASPELGYAVYDVADSKEFSLTCIDVGYAKGVVWLLGTDELLRYDAASGDTATLPLTEEYNQLAAAPDGVWLAKDAELTKLDADGNTLAALSLAEKPSDIVCDAAGVLYAAQKKTVALVTADGNTGEISTPDGYTPGTLCALGGGDAAVFASRLKSEQPGILRLSAAEKTAKPFDGEEPSFPYFFPGDGNGDYYYVKSSKYELLSEGKQVFHYSEGKSSLIFDLAGLGYDGRLRGIFPLDRDFLVVYSTADTVGVLRLVRTERTKKILTIARAESNGQLLMLIARFNSASRDTYIVSKFYDDENGEQRLYMDFLAGERPDILSLNGLTPEVFAAKGLLVDLYPMLDKSERISRQDLQQSILRVLESSDGGLYELCPSYALSTCAIDRQYIGDDRHMYLDELYAACEANPELTLYGDQRGYAVLNFLLSSVFYDFADLEKRELRFDSPEFIRFLELVKEMDERAKDFTGDYSYTDGNVLLCPLTITEVEHYRTILQLDEMKRLAITGFPSNSGTGCLITAPMQFGIVAGTGNEEAAWEFFEYMLSEAEQVQQPMLPICVSALESQITAVGEDVPAHSETRYVDPYGAKAGTNMETETVQIPETAGLTEQEIADFRQILDSVELVYNERMTNPCFGIVYEECRGLLTGERDAEATAKAIQSKMELYLAERS